MPKKALIFLFMGTLLAIVGANFLYNKGKSIKKEVGDCSSF